jgi:hypothetical protein
MSRAEGHNKLSLKVTQSSMLPIIIDHILDLKRLCVIFCGSVWDAVTNKLY